MKPSVVVITLNEDGNIGECLRSLSWADEIVVLDSGSTDRTERICRDNDRVRWYVEEWKGFGPQKNSAVAKASGPWVLCVDADERVTPELAAEILRLDLGRSPHAGYRIPRKSHFGKTWVRHGGWYPDRTIRLWRKDSGRFDDRSVHEGVRVEGSVGTLRGDLLHYTYRDTSDFAERMNRYSSLGAREMYKEGRRASLLDLLFRPPFTFFRMFAIKRGFLDGMLGFRLAVLYAMYTYLKYDKLRELASGGEFGE